MKQCNECQRPLKNGFYRGQSGRCYCYDCFMRAKDQLPSILQMQNDVQKRLHDAYEKERMLIKKIENEGYSVHRCDGKYGAFGRIEKPAYILDLVSELNMVHNLHNSVYNERQNRTPRIPSDILTAIYCESEDDELQKFGGVL